MLREYQLTNFKAFAGPEKLPIRPITLIYGPNSSGKSSVLQSLLLLKQTLQEAEDPDTVLLPKGNLVNLGSYREFIHQHDVSQSFSFKVKLKLDEQELQEDFWKIVPENFELASILELQVTFAYDEETSNVVLSSIELFLGEDSSSLICYRPLEQNSRPDESESFHNTALKKDIINDQHIIWLKWYEQVKEVISKRREEEVKKIFIKLKLQEKRRKGWTKRLPEELYDCKKELEDNLVEINRDEIERKEVEKVLF
ncbi:MAG: AAA family ATPase [Hormoscilla sp. SP12CHS1]|nr:AAA family ATPase [Hormoscilla sp. SP12CHS1]